MKLIFHPTGLFGILFRKEGRRVDIVEMWKNITRLREQYDVVLHP